MKNLKIRFTNWWSRAKKKQEKLIYYYYLWRIRCLDIDNEVERLEEVEK